VSFDDWLLALHVAAAFAVVGAVTVFTILIVVGRRTDSPADFAAVTRIAPVANILVQAGSVVAILVGIWIAIRRPEYHPWDGWLIGAYVLWAIAAGSGAQAGKAYTAIIERARELVAAGQLGPSPELRERLHAPRPLMFHLVTMTAVLLLVADMIFKPGA
jgi:hypothetical protein